MKTDSKPKIFRLTYKFRLYPEKKQEEKLLWTLDKCRFIYNSLLDKSQKENLNWIELSALLPKLKEEYPELKSVYSKVIQYENDKLFNNLKTLSQLKKNGKRMGRLRFKGKNWLKSFTYNQSGFKLIEVGKRHQILHLSKIGDIKIRCHRNIKGKVKQITIKKERSCKWFALISIEEEISIKNQSINKVVGIDLGLNNIIYDSDNNKIINPKHLKKHEKRLILLQKRLSKKKKSSKNREKVRLRLARQYEKLTNIRNDFLHKISRSYVDNYDAIGMENIHIKNFVKNNRLSKSILDASWGKLRQFISYKAERAGKIFVTVDCRGTTQRCSQCGNIVAKDLSERIHKCPYCGFIAPRDYNSALDVRRLTIGKIGRDMPEFKPVEIALAAELRNKVYESSINEAGSSTI